MTEADSEDDQPGPSMPYRPRTKTLSKSKSERSLSKKAAQPSRKDRKERRNTVGKSHKHRPKRNSIHSVMKTEPPHTPPSTAWTDSLSMRPSNDAGPSPLSPLGAGRLDPFGVYPSTVYQSTGALPLYVHEVIDHCINHTSLAFVPSDDPNDLSVIKRHIMMSVMSDALSWYTVVLAGVTHLSFARGETEIPREKQLLRLSYKTEAMSGIREDITNNGGVASDRVLLAINTLSSHGALDDISGFKQDKIQNRKAFGAANDMNYYTIMRPGTQHWLSLVKFVEDRGGIKSTLQSPGLATGIAFCDVLFSWRELEPPKFPCIIDTEEAIKASRHKPDADAISFARRLLSGFASLMDTRWLYARLMVRLKHIRCIIVDFEQWQRKASSLPDIRRLYWLRHFLLHDLLSLPMVSQRLGGSKTELGYELCRLSCLAFMQLVIYPLASMNQMPEKILKKILPVLDLWTKPAEGKVLSQEHPGVFLWALVLASMLAFEHYETMNDSAWMDSVAQYFDRVTIKAEKRAWPMVKSIMGTYLWLDSECDASGQRAWNYACLWLAARDE
ncbi:uncharacterized protein HMPREF1541_05471 [Cyphellophora europaea CBS 101466]|uniref:Transcription factor domain-containing protein n=1 Tax=Cyphellophora europaea (strain CBS 101466) TaxID=1220924 RepID=W2RU02_CYPE1|nr:uncharacterized protein HMPREF1541_05471 [Cyphellophora europaea CBS 101466]ETN39248.1 hypothetical protein HMPREF1541_05471 [Cyphellophora europaea CBS 101466]